jgi:lipopolysaccharide transport system permease protein
MSVSSAIRDVRDSRDLTVNLTLRELRGRYKRSVLGWAWSLVNPLATMAVFTVVFSTFLKITPEPGDPSGLHVFALFLLCGLLPWTFFSNSMVGGMGALVGNAGLISKVWFPRSSLVVATVSAAAFSLLIELGVLLVALLIAGNMILPWLPVLLVILVLQAVFALGVALLLSVCNVYFRDTQHLIGILLQLWFYASPIVYPVSVVRQNVSSAVFRIYEFNPMYSFIEAYRDVLYDLRMPPASRFATMAISAAVSMIVGALVFRRLEPRMAEEL